MKFAWPSGQVQASNVKGGESDKVYAGEMTKAALSLASSGGGPNVGPQFVPLYEEMRIIAGSGKLSVRKVD